uniref:Beta-fructofuranosidase n=1 Tax=Kalanchoe fedtschenkoi TaxID=63787 RepID=A0A7N0UUB2_KALFE
MARVLLVRMQKSTLHMLRSIWDVGLLLVVLILCSNGVAVEGSHKVYPQYQSLSVSEVKTPGRTGYHFQPPRNWINDPNGPMYFNGYYHLFYQYNPKGATWGNIVWAHSVSKDLVNWEPLPHAISPSEPFDIRGCWSGSATVLPGNKPVILYTGIDPQERQVQNYAVPKNISDPYLREWVKPLEHNPIVTPTKGINASAFRDPTTAWRGKDGIWRMIIGSKNKRRGIAYLYKSCDFLKWVKHKHPLHSRSETGMWECPDFFPVSTKHNVGLETSAAGEDIKHVLKVSLDLTRYEYYTVGTYDERKDRYVPDGCTVDGWKGLRYDYGNFYASKTFYDTDKKRRILWGWANESDSALNDTAKGWAGIQAIPREVWLDHSGKQLIQWPIKEIEGLRSEHVELVNLELTYGSKIEIEGITPAQADVEITFEFPRSSLKNAEEFEDGWEKLDALDICKKKGANVKGGVGPFGLVTLASQNLEELTPVSFRIFRDTARDKYITLMCSDATRSSLFQDKKWYKPAFAGYVDADLTDGKLSLRSLIDHSVVESFGHGGKTCITSRVYPTLAIKDKAHLYVFNNGTTPVKIEKLTAWSMKRPNKMN